MMKRISNIITYIITFLLNPISPITLLFISILFNTLFTNNEDLPKYLSFVSNLKVDYIINIIIIWFAMAIIYSYLVKRKKDFLKKIEELEKRLDSKDRQIENNSSIFYNKFADLSSFTQKQKMYNLLKEFVNNNSIVQSAQIYNYTTKLNAKNNYQIKIKFIESYSYQDVEINAILQSYYLIPKYILNEFISIIELLHQLKEDKFASEEIFDCLYEKFEQKIDNLLGKLLSKLNKLKTVSQCNEYYALLYRISLILINILYYESGLDIINILKNQEIENTLKSLKRTGILGSILLEDTYFFRHTGKSTKNGRIYTTFYFKLYNQNYILLLTLPSHSLANKWNKDIKNLENDFDSRFYSTFSKEM